MKATSKNYKNAVLPIALLSATIIGAGVFSLPYATKQSGWIISLVYLVFSTIVFYILHTMYADIILRDEKKYKFAGYARNYLGDGGYYVSILATVLGAIITLSVYIILGESFSQIIFTDSPLLKNSVYIFWIIASTLIFINLKRMARLEFLITAAMVFLIFIIFALGATEGTGKITDLAAINLRFVLIPFGPFLFSFSGRSAIPSLVDYFKENKISFSKIKKVIFWGTFLPAIVYAMFIIGIIGMAKTVTEDSVASIATLPYLMTVIIAITGILSILSSYIMVGLSTKEILEKDLDFPKIWANLIIIFLPIILIEIGLSSFIRAITIAGGIFLAMEGMIIAMIWEKIEDKKIKKVLFKKKLPKILINGIIITFFLGAVYAILF